MRDKAIAANMKELMKQRHISRKELSRRLTRIIGGGFSVSSIDRALSGHHKITDRRLSAIARVLNVSLETLTKAPHRG